MYLKGLLIFYIMSNILLNIIIVTVIFIPMAYFMFSGNKEKSAVKHLKDKLKAFDIMPDIVNCFQGAGIALDKSKSTLYFYQYEGEILTKTAISEINKADVSKLYQTESVHDHDISVLKSVSILLKMKDKSEVSLPVFSILKHPNVGADLMEAVRWSEMINKLVNK